jgi:hypothetical protein
LRQGREYCARCGWPAAAAAACEACGHPADRPSGAEDHLDLHALEGATHVHHPDLAAAAAAASAGDYATFVGRCLRAAGLAPVVVERAPERVRWRCRAEAAVLQLTLTAGELVLEVPALRLPARLQVPAMRRLLEWNAASRDFRFCLRGDVVVARFDAVPGRISALRFARAADRAVRHLPGQIGALADLFAAQALRTDADHHAEAALSGAVALTDAARRSPAPPASAPPPREATLADLADARVVATNQLCEFIRESAAMVRPLRFVAGAESEAALLMRSAVVLLATDHATAVPHVASLVLRYAGGVLGDIWPAQKTGWLDRLVPREDPHASALRGCVEGLLRLFDQLVEARAQVAAQPARELPRIGALAEARGHLRNVVAFLRERAPGPEASRLVLRAAAIELTTRVTLPDPVRRRLEATLQRGGGDLLATLEGLA